MPNEYEYKGAHPVVLADHEYAESDVLLTQHPAEDPVSWDSGVEGTSPTLRPGTGVLFADGVVPISVLLVLRTVDEKPTEEPSEDEPVEKPAAVKPKARRASTRTKKEEA